ncbi:SHOCT domain-containing protein [Amphritea balenae]|mgnify:CR=1 FL=1|uniref:SHOCT domain-containing protein n=1 Tax=Amphritea balenae TaxID=452629 RepID=A0A3P1SI96_9GAMM|nr:SHOCT domain-containing protein [Amphritea balenae]RRC96757.1 SHOCT domain-containing protein [Amphritea balenae]
MSQGKVILSLAVSAVLLQGCAGSANHEVMTAYNASDESLSCEQLSYEQARAQTVINQVNEDKDDVSGADIVDGIFWFPFNLIAKNMNYEDALEAANARIARLDSLRNSNNCSDEQMAEVEKGLEAKLTELKDLRDKDLISEEEYKKARKDVLFNG